MNPISSTKEKKQLYHLVTKLNVKMISDKWYSDMRDSCVITNIKWNG